MNEPSNQFDKLDAQAEESRFAQFTTEEHAEYQSWLDMVALHGASDLDAQSTSF